MSERFGVSLSARDDERVEGNFYAVSSGSVSIPYDAVAGFRDDPQHTPIVIPGFGPYVMLEAGNKLQPNGNGVISATGLTLMEGVVKDKHADCTADVYIRKAPRLSRVFARIFKRNTEPEISWNIPSLSKPNQPR